LKSLSCRPSNQNSVGISVFPMRPTFLAHLIFFDLTTLIICGDEYKLWISLLCSFFGCDAAEFNSFGIFRTKGAVP
jgi:hypothetical protein